MEQEKNHKQSGPGHELRGEMMGALELRIFKSGQEKGQCPWAVPMSSPRVSDSAQWGLWCVELDWVHLLIH